MAIRKQCDMCKAYQGSGGCVEIVGEPSTWVYSTITLKYTCEINMADEWEKPDFEIKTRAERFDLCEKCAREIYKMITGHSAPNKIL